MDQMLEDSGYTDIRVLQNASGNGFDLVARGPSGNRLVVEVKSSSKGIESIKNLSEGQKFMDKFVEKTLKPAAEGSGRYQNLSAEDRAFAQELYKEWKMAPENFSGANVGVDLSGGEPCIHVSNWAQSTDPASN